MPRSDQSNSSPAEPEAADGSQADASQADASQAEGDASQDEPRNRAERRAQRRGKRPPLTDGSGPVRQPSLKQTMVPPRRASRRGNR